VSLTNRLLLLMPVAMLLHNVEEYFGMERYARRRRLAPSRRQIQIALGLATVLPTAIAGLAVCSPRGSRRKLLGLALPGAMLANTASHLGQTLLFHDRSPGTYTALGLVAPLSLYLEEQSVRDGYLTHRERWRIMGIGAAVMLPSVLVLQGLGWLANRLLPDGGHQVESFTASQGLSQQTVQACYPGGETKPLKATAGFL
jgi:hypothetical protein